MKKNKIISTSYSLIFLNLIWACFVFFYAPAQNAVAQDLAAALSAPDYPVTAGDTYALVYGSSTDSETKAVELPIIVDHSYRIRVSNLGYANAAGKTYQQLKRQVEAIVLENHPFVSVQFIMRQPAAFNVYIKGEVKAASSIRAWALTRVSDVLAYSGQAVLLEQSLAENQLVTSGRSQNSILTEYASMRDVKVVSSNGSQKTYDLFKAVREGDLSQNPYVRPGDVIIVSKVSRRVSVSGAVNRPGSYQLLKNENLKTLIDFYADGFTPLADKTQISILRYTSAGRLKSEEIKLTENDFENDFKLLDYDYITIKPITNMYPVAFIDPTKSYYITVAGAVRAPSRYPFTPDRTWEYYIALAGGFIKGQNAFNSVTLKDLDGNKLKKSSIIRPETVITANTNDFLYYFNQYAPVIATVISITMSYISLQTTLKALR